MTITGGTVTATNDSKYMPAVGGYGGGTVEVTGGIAAAHNSGRRDAFGGNPTFQNAIVFQSGAGRIYGDVTLNRNLWIGNSTEMRTLCISYGASLGGSGTVVDGTVGIGSSGNFTTENLTPEMIQIPRNLNTGMTEEEIAATITIENPTVCGLLCQVVGWSAPVVAKKAGTANTYTVAYTRDGGSDTVTKEFEVSLLTPVTYVDENGEEQTAQAVLLTGSNSDAEFLREGVWYAVDGTATRKVLVAAKNARLILTDGCDLNAALFVPEGANFQVYRQSGDTGAWTLPLIEGFTDENGVVTIMTSSIHCAGSLIIHGGRIDCTGLYVFGNMTLNGGSVRVPRDSNVAYSVINEGTFTINRGTFEVSDRRFTGSGKYQTSVLPESTEVKVKTLIANGSDQSEAVKAEATPDLSYSGQPFDLVGWTLSTVTAVENDTSQYRVTYTKDGSGESVTLPLQLTTEAEVQTVTYLDADGNQKTQAGCKLLTGQLPDPLPGGWYVMKGNVSGDLNTNADSSTVHLILADGCHFDGNVFVKMNLPTNDSLHIYAQSTGSDMGSMTSSKVLREIISRGNLTINGGRITYSGLSVDGSCTINGGIVDITNLNGVAPVYTRGIVFKRDGNRLRRRKARRNPRHSRNPHPAHSGQRQPKRLHAHRRQIVYDR